MLVPHCCWCYPENSPQMILSGWFLTLAMGWGVDHCFLVLHFICIERHFKTKVWVFAKCWYLGDAKQLQGFPSVNTFCTVEMLWNQTHDCIIQKWNTREVFLLVLFCERYKVSLALWSNCLSLCYAFFWIKSSTDIVFCMQGRYWWSKRR